MAFSRKEVSDYFLRAKGNVSLAMVMYISEKGCNGFNCKSCPLMKACPHYPVVASSVAIQVLSRINDLQKENQKK